MDGAGWRWAVVFVAATLLHVAVALALFALPANAPPVAAGAGGVQIALGRAPAAAGAAGGANAATDQPDTEEVVADTAIEPPPEPVPSPPEPEAQPEIVPQPVEPVELPTTEPVPEPELEPEPVSPAPTQSEPSETTEEPSEVLATGDPSQYANESEPGTGESEAQDMDGAGSSGAEMAGTDVSSATTNVANTVTGAGNAGAELSYSATLSAWLERHKRYPRRSKRRREEGTALLYLLVARDGRVLDYRIERSAGFAALDEELLAMVERAQPLPAFPTELRAAQMEYVLPVDFTLR